MTTRCEDGLPRGATQTGRGLHGDRWCRSWCRLSGEKEPYRGKLSETECAPTVGNC